ncbi:MAG: NAD-dependent epimerase/dehydratase family protein [Burkholderiales bacterium]|nr:NAD-dependent epimerase/dehydratase family protein [Burkholderiales bacterium]MDE1925913.1 NAD-dependent epimerase/dehydratase family protein [Burkholderiales bacterium]MDE2157430.1 NAD-dependent epimerase/dehydratase family protein [Burkholderiales bacterium]
MKSHVLVTGGAGFIGSWLVERLLDAGRQVTVLDNLSPQIHGTKPVQQLLPLDRDGLRFERGDVRDRELLDRLLATCDEVVHLAAETGTGQSMYRIDHYYDVNLQATARLFELVGTRHKQIRRIVLASSRSVYGEGAYRLGNRILVPAGRSVQRMAAGLWEPVGPAGEALELIATPEDAPARPSSIYALTKLAGEQLAQVFADTYGVSVVALRFQNVYGERQSLSNPYTGILSIFSNRMRQNLPINLFEDGQESRDFVHVSDVVRAIDLALERARPGMQIINIGSGVATSVERVAQLLAQRLASRSQLDVSGDFRAGDIRHCYADLGRAAERLGFAPEVTLERGLDAFCDWVRRQPVVADGSVAAQRELCALGLGRAQP